MTPEEKNTDIKKEVAAREVNRSMLEKLEITQTEFEFNDTKDLIGRAIKIESSNLDLHIADSDKLSNVHVGRLVAIKSMLDKEWLIGAISKVEKDEKDHQHRAMIALVGTITFTKKGVKFTRSLVHIPEIDAVAYQLEEKNLSLFMHSVSQAGSPSDLQFGYYKLDSDVAAFVDGNKLFQRHAALVGSTGCGKSWTVSTIIEQTAKLANTNVVILDIHHEYGSLSYAKRLHVAGPGDTDPEEAGVIFFPVWFLTYDEIINVFLDKNDPDSPTQALLLNKVIREKKLEFCRINNKEDLMKSLTVDSPIPFNMNEVISKLKYINEELVPGLDQGEVVKGPYYGKFDKFLPRIEAKRGDKRYNFIFGGGKGVHTYEYFNHVVHSLLGTGREGKKNLGVKILDLSGVPSDVLPVVVSTIGRFLFSVQYWSPPKNRHPIVLVCDEAHLYLPQFENCDELQRNTVFHFGRIAKEGRKYGIALFVISQRPSDVNKSILSQCGNLMTLRLTNAEDQSVVKKLMPDSMTGLIEMLPLLGIGELIAIGDSVILPLVINVTPPNEPPTSETINFCDAWAGESKEHLLDHGIESMRRQIRSD